ncbi:MAG TPA: hypothetical protein VI756_20010 [Blastocatellia bacterium]
MKTARAENGSGKNRASGNGSDGANFGEIGNGQARAGEARIIEWTARRQERYLTGRSIKSPGRSLPRITLELGIAALDLALDLPDSAGPSFKVLIDAVRLFGTLVRSNVIPLKTAARTEHGSTR